MATIDYASKYSGQVVEKFKEGSKSDKFINNDYEFSGVQSVLVYNNTLPTLGDYKRTGTNRFGDLQELNLTKEEMKMTQEKSFSFVIDHGDESDTQGAMNAGKMLARTIKEVVVPELDKYRFAKMATSAHTKIEETITAENVYTVITDATEALDDLEIPEEGRVLACNPKVYKLLKQCKDVILDTELSDEQRKRGVLGMIDGLEIVKVPSARLPENCEFIVSHSMACTAPVKLAVYRILTEVQGIHGAVAEGLVYHDAFVLEERKKMIVACSAPSMASEKAKKSK